MCRWSALLDAAVALEWVSVIRDEAVHEEALVEKKREGHRGLAGRRIVGGMRRRVQEPEGGMVVFPKEGSGDLSEMTMF